MDSQQNEDRRKLYVSGLSKELTVDDLTRHFGSFGKISSVNWKNENMSHSSNFAFVIFEQEETLNKVLSCDHHIKGRNVFAQKVMEPCIPDFEESGLMTIKQENKEDVKTEFGRCKSRSSRAGLRFPIGRIHRRLRKGAYAECVGADAPVYLAAVIEYLTTDVLFYAGRAAHNNKKTRIIPRHLQIAILDDKELNKLFDGVIIAQGGVLPKIQAALLPKKT